MWYAQTLSFRLSLRHFLTRHLPEARVRRNLSLRAPAAASYARGSSQSSHPLPRLPTAEELRDLDQLELTV